MIRVLDPQEVEKIVSLAKEAHEHTMTAILDELEQNHPAVYRMIYGEPSDGIARMNMDMSQLYLDLSFDVVWVFREAFGLIPKCVNKEPWVYERLSLIDAELKSLSVEVPMDKLFRMKLQKRFASVSFESKIQLSLLQYLNDEVVKYASFKTQRTAAIHVTKNLLLFWFG